MVAMEEEARGRGGRAKRRKRQARAERSKDSPPPTSALSPLRLPPRFPFPPTTPARTANLSFEPPSPQLFSFNSPQGMCPECSGLGQIYTFDPERLIPDPSRSFQQGCIELVGTWREMGRWRRHIYRGVAETLERKHGLPSGTVLETAWEELDPKLQHALLWGTGDEHITFTWRSGPSGYKWGGKFEGIIPKLLSQYRTTRSRLQRRQLEKYMCILGLRPLPRRAAESAGAGGHRHQPLAEVRRSPRALAARGLRAGRLRGRGVLRRAGAGRHGPEDRRRGAQGDSRPAAIPQERGPRISHARPHRARRSPAAKCSASGWPGRSAAGWWACCTFSTSRRSACTRATTTACWKRLPGSATRATP